MRVEFVACGAVAWYIVLAYCVEKKYIRSHFGLSVRVIADSYVEGSAKPFIGFATRLESQASVLSV